MGARTPAPPELWPDIEIPLLAELEPDVRELQKLVPELDLSLWPSFASLAGAPTSAKPAESPIRA